MSWHIDRELLRSYCEGRLGDVASFSLEAHLIACDACRTLMSDAIEPERRAAIWTGVLDSIDRPRQRPIEGPLAWLGVPADVARLVVDRVQQSNRHPVEIDARPAIFVSLFVPSEGARGGGEGELIYYTMLEEG